MIRFTLNGKEVSLDIEPNTPTLWAVREELGLKGAKYGCGMGLCGACTMHLNGQAVRTCVLPISSVDKQQLTTIEGLARDGELHVVQQAWQEHNVPQCGYCQPGQIMTAAALFERNNNPSDTDIEQTMQGNICRCGTYPRIVKAMKCVRAQCGKATDNNETE